jgi:predicted nucleic acid-binding protein
MRAVLWDSSAILALLDVSDTVHARAVEIAGQLADERLPSLMTNYTEVEAHALLVRRLGRSIARRWLLASTLPVARALPSEEARAKQMLARYADKDWTFCDAISFAVIEMRQLERSFSFDHHFRQFGRVHVLGLDR